MQLMSSFILHYDFMKTVRWCHSSAFSAVKTLVYSSLADSIYMLKWG